MNIVIIFTVHTALGATVQYSTEYGIVPSFRFVRGRHRLFGSSSTTARAEAEAESSQAEP